MEELLQQVLDFLRANNLDNMIISIIISIVGVIAAFVRTGTKSIQKKAGYVNLNNFHISDYVIIYNNEVISFDKVVIKKKADITKLELSKYIDKGGVFNAKTKNE